MAMLTIRSRLLLVALLACGPLLVAQEQRVDQALDRQYPQTIQPLLKQYCLNCHSTKAKKGELDLQRFSTIKHVQADLITWRKVIEMLRDGEMPPKDKPQLTAEQKQNLLRWTEQVIEREIRRRAGDPGPVVLRRLNNEEYNYTVRDLTGVNSLAPTREFPVDGAAGEGFINAGSAQSMSPSFVTKYLDAAKEVASHAVLLPDGITFSANRSRRDWTDEHLASIRNFYDQFTISTDIFVNVGGAGKLSNQGGAIPLPQYLAATLEERDALKSGRKTIPMVASERSLNAKYLGMLWQVLATRPTASGSLLLDDLRHKWQQATPADAPRIAATIEQAQKQLWKFNSIGQLTEGGKQKIWMEPVSPIVTQQQVRLPLPATAGASMLAIYLSADDLSDGRAHDFVVWQRPRFEFKPDASGITHPPILLRDIPALIGKVQQTIDRELPRTTRYLEALAKLQGSDMSLDEIAKQEDLNAPLLKQWSRFVGIGRPANRNIQGHFTTKQLRVHGHAEVNGWGPPTTPNVLANSSKEDIRFLTLTVPARGITMHPSPTQEAIAHWRSPLEGKVRIKGRVADVDDVCGNGAAWRVELLSESGTVTLAQGEFDNGGTATFQPKGEFTVRRGDVVSLVVNSRNKNHGCDTTHVELTLSEIDGKKRNWDLASDVVDRVVDSNPLPDSYGNVETWHFCATGNNPKPSSVLVPGSALAQWHAAVKASKPAAETTRLGKTVQSILIAADDKTLAEPDRKLRGQLRSWTGPLHWTTVTDPSGSPGSPKDSRVITPPQTFGKHPNGAVIDAASLCLQAPQVLELQLPAALVGGSEFVVSAELHTATARGGSVRVTVSRNKPTSGDLSTTLAVLVSREGKASSRVETAMTDFRNLFPPALCYSRIVPVDEVVTMTLYFREDDHLKRLMLNEAQAKELDRLWDELFYVAQAPIALTVAFEQICEFATQDRPDLVKVFEPMRKPINARADLFRKRLVETEPAHLNAVMEFADRAWRRPLARHLPGDVPGPREEDALRDFYKRLRTSGISHEQAIRLTLARVLTSPTFLYRREQAGPGKDAVPVSNTELATRLSYFIWSSLPDAPLRQVADAGQLSSDKILQQQAQRMLKDPRSRRLAIQFACQWLHLRNFDQNDDKNEKLYPQFATLRHDMYEETVRFFEDMFRNDGSILDLLNADHTFLNQSLAKHYGIAGITGPEWRRVNQVRRRGRGGILGMSSLLASQSGASRTSPILRGNWVYETLLGERLPRPPANVPQLPENVPTGQTARQLIEQHSSVAACAKCHAKIDPFGFALEQYDAIGRLRSSVVDTSTKLADGTEIDGIDGLRQYLLTKRRDDFVRQFCRKLLGFSLGRELHLSDELLLDTMHDKLEANGFRFSTAVETIVLSSQFRRIRGAANPSQDR